jgi:hypothetical protein
LLTCPRWRSRPHRWPFRCRDGGRSIKHGRSCAYAHECQGHRRRGGTFDTVMPLSRGARLVPEEREILILVGYASKHGATAEIAERIAEILTLAGQHAEARPVQQTVIWAAMRGSSSAVPLTRRTGAFVMSNRDLLAHRPMWLFSTGPLGTDATDPKGVDLRTTAEPKEIPDSGRRSTPETTTSSVPSIPAGSPSPRRRCESSRPLAR